MVRAKSKPGKMGGDPLGAKILVENESKLVNQAIEVYWNDDEAWYSGVIEAVKPSHKKDGVSKPHHVVYEDGDKEFVDLKNEIWRLVEQDEQKILNPDTSKPAEKRKKRTDEDTKDEGPAKQRSRRASENLNNKENGNDEEIVDKDQTTNECIEVNNLEKLLLAKTETVQVEQCVYKPTLFQISLVLPVQDMQDVKVRCGETCVVIDSQEKRSQEQAQTQADPLVQQNHELIVILPKKIDNKSASAFMNRQGQIKVQVLALTNEKGEEHAIASEWD